MKIITLFVLTLFTLTFQVSYGQDYLESATSTGSGTTASNTWSTVTSVTIDVGSLGETSNVLVTVSINMRPDGSNTNTREANYRIYRSGDATDNSGIIKREVYSNADTSIQSWGIGTLVHIFDTSSLSGNITYMIEHSNQSDIEPNRNVYSNIQLTAVALTTEINGNNLSNDIKRITNGTSIPTSYEAVPGLTTDPISLPLKGDIYVATSINSTANYAFLDNDRVAEYKLEYSTDDGINWTDLGKPVSRNLYVSSFWVEGFNDSGIISLVGVLPNQNAGSTYRFRVAHKIEGGFIEDFKTENSNLIAIALAHQDGYFPSFYSEVGIQGVDIIGKDTPALEVTSSSFTACTDIGGVGPNLYVDAQYSESASNLNESAVPPQRMIASNQLFLDNGTTTIAANNYLRYLDRNDRFGSGGFIGLAEDLDSGGNYTISMKHAVDFVSNPDGTQDETLTTSEVILTGFQTYDKPASSLGILDNELTKKLKIYSTPTTVEVRNEHPIDGEIKIYTVLGQLISTNYLKNETATSINVYNQKSILIVLIKIDGDVLAKKVILN